LSWRRRSSRDKWLYGLAAGIFFIGGIAFFVMRTLATQNYLRQEQTLADNSTYVLVIAVGMGGLAPFVWPPASLSGW
jgi:hypothetical protein